MIVGKHYQIIKRNIAYLLTPEYRNSSTRFLRIESFKKCVAEFFGVPNPEQYVHTIEFGDVSRTKKLLNKFCAGTESGQKPVVMGINNVMTLHILTEMKAMQLSAPDDIGVCGYDDWSWGDKMNWAQLIDKGITTCDMNATEAGAEAARLLLNRIENPDMPKKEIIMPIGVHIRGSTMLRGG